MQTCTQFIHLFLIAKPFVFCWHCLNLPRGGTINTYTRLWKNELPKCGQLGLPLYLNLLVCCQLWWIDCVLANLVWLLDLTIYRHWWCKVSPYDVLLDYCLKYSKSFIQNDMYNANLLWLCNTFSFDFINSVLVKIAIFLNKQMKVSCILT